MSQEQTSPVMNATVSAALTLEEEAALRGAGLDPRSYAAVHLPALSTQVGEQRGSQPLVLFQTVHGVPRFILQVEFSSLAGPDGKPIPSPKTARQLPFATVPPMLRVLAARETLNADLQKQLVLQDAALTRAPQETTS
jgi:hypothetical protein